MRDDRDDCRRDLGAAVVRDGRGFSQFVGDDVVDVDRAEEDVIVLDV